MKRRTSQARARAYRSLLREMEPEFDTFYRDVRDLEKSERDPYPDIVGDRDLVAVEK